MLLHSTTSRLYPFYPQPPHHEKKVTTTYDECVSIYFFYCFFFFVASLVYDIRMAGVICFSYCLIHILFFFTTQNDFITNFIQCSKSRALTFTAGQCFCVFSLLLLPSLSYHISYNCRNKNLLIHSLYYSLFL